MARKSINLTLGQSLGGGKYSSSVASSDVPSFPATTTVAADVATLVADGASPTQAHVTTLNSDWGTLNTAVAAVSTAISSDMSVVWDNAKITNLNQLRAALNAALLHAQSGYGGLAE
jgi:hypothetical protein